MDLALQLCKISKPKSRLSYDLWLLMAGHLGLAVPRGLGQISTPISICIPACQTLAQLIVAASLHSQVRKRLRACPISALRGSLALAAGLLVLVSVRLYLLAEQSQPIAASPRTRKISRVHATPAPGSPQRAAIAMMEAGAAGARRRCPNSPNNAPTIIGRKCACEDEWDAGRARCLMKDPHIILWFAGEREDLQAPPRTLRYTAPACILSDVLGPCSLSSSAPDSAGRKIRCKPCASPRKVPPWCVYRPA